MNSDDFIVYDFNLAALLKLSDLNLLHVAEDNKNLTVGEYFRMLSQFLSLAPDVSDAIKKFADDASGNKDWKSIKSMIALFKEMGCYKFLPALDGIRNAHGKGDHKLASIHAGKAEQSFHEFYSRIMSAKISKKTDSTSDTNPKLRTEGSQSANTILLSCIKELAGKEAGYKPLVLTVDDSPAILEAVSAVLSSEYNVFKLPKPAMLENVLKQVNPDLFLLDYKMPDLNGFNLIPIIRSFEEHKDTPIIFLTSEGTVDNITAAIGLGACDFIVKPFNPDQLREKVAKHIVS